eukprot:14783832-Alexandrium_andersonii.AAC.1
MPCGASSELFARAGEVSPASLPRLQYPASAVSTATPLAASHRRRTAQLSSGLANALAFALHCVQWAPI